MTKKELKLKMKTEATELAKELKVQYYRAQYERTIIKRIEKQVSNEMITDLSYSGYSVSPQEIKEATSMKEIEKIIEGHKSYGYGTRWTSLKIAVNEKTGKFVKFVRAIPKQIQKQIAAEIKRLVSKEGINIQDNSRIINLVDGAVSDISGRSYYSKGNPYKNIKVLSRCDKYYNECNHDKIEIKENRWGYSTKCIGNFSNKRMIDFFRVALSIKIKSFKKINNIITGQRASNREKDKAPRVNTYEYGSREYELIERMKSIKENHDYKLNEIANELLSNDDKLPEMTSSIKSELIYKLKKSLNRLQKA